MRINRSVNVETGATMADMNDKACSNTGATPGIGLNTAIGLAERGTRWDCEPGSVDGGDPQGGR